MKPHKISPVMALIICGQGLILTIVNSALYASFSKSYPTFQGETLAIILSATLMSMVLTSILGMKATASLSKKESTLDNQSLYINDVTQLLSTLKSQRHDFINNFQTVYGLIRLGNNNDAINYLERTISEVGELSKIVSFKQPVISALLQIKSDIAKNRGIIFEIIPMSTLGNIKADFYDLSRILGNLIENSFDAVMDEPPEKRKVWLAIREVVSNYIFDIGNFGRPIPEEIRNKIFEPGYSTKVGQLRGMGLYIVKNLVEKNSGVIGFSSDSGLGTVFTIVFLKDKNEKPE